MMARIARRESIAEDLAEIARIHSRLKHTASPQLNHFLERRSYAKALALLDDGTVADDPARPPCDEGVPHP
jgi:hypothetical protein